MITAKEARTITDNIIKQQPEIELGKILMTIQERAWCGMDNYTLEIPYKEIVVPELQKLGFNVDTSSQFNKITW